MWCDKCQADVAAMASSDNERLYCTACNGELPRPVAAAVNADPRAASVSRKSLSDPRELLARWAREDALGALGAAPPIARQSTEPKLQLRFDGSHVVPVPTPQSNVIDRIAQKGPAESPLLPPAAPEMPAHDIVIHAAHGIGGPHFQPTPVPTTTADSSSKWVTLLGQVCAYFGVLGLFFGTVLVLIGYFSGPSSYATTGWLVTTAGQMLLFLGVITLVSGGMEQTTQEVARRIDTLGERLIRIEYATQTNGKNDKPQQIGTSASES